MDRPIISTRVMEEKSLEVEVALIAITRRISFFEDVQSEGWKQPWRFADKELELSGIIIERWRGLARRIGVVHSVGMKQWVAANPQKELLVLA